MRRASVCVSRSTSLALPTSTSRPLSCPAAADLPAESTRCRARSVVPRIWKAGMRWPHHSWRETHHWRMSPSQRFHVDTDEVGLCKCACVCACACACVCQSAPPPLPHPHHLNVSPLHTRHRFLGHVIAVQKPLRAQQRLDDVTASGADADPHRVRLSRRGQFVGGGGHAGARGGVHECGAADARRASHLRACALAHARPRARAAPCSRGGQRRRPWPVGVACEHTHARTHARTRTPHLESVHAAERPRHRVQRAVVVHHVDLTHTHAHAHTHACVHSCE